VLQRDLPFGKPANEPSVNPDIRFEGVMPVTAYFQKNEGSLWQRKIVKRRTDPTVILLITEFLVLLGIYAYFYFQVLTL
jgi:hypothetical protein